MPQALPQHRNPAQRLTTGSGNSFGPAGDGFGARAKRAVVPHAVSGFARGT